MIQQQVQAWKWLKQQVSKVGDPMLRNAMMVEFRQRALREWGYCPDDGSVAKDSDVVLDDWERDFATGIKGAADFGVDPRKGKREAEIHEARSRMRHFVEHGGCLMDIPEHLRTPFIEQLFYEALDWYGDQLMEACDAVSNR